MILIENRNYLRSHNHSLLDRLNQTEGRPGKGAEVELSRQGTPTLKLDINGVSQYVHSKYDPERETERLINGLPSLEKFNHVLFIGTGLGYSVKAFASAYPDKRFSLYEPDKRVLTQLLSIQDLNEWAGQLALITDDERELKGYFRDSASRRGEQFYFCILPIYQKVYQKQIDRLLKELRDTLTGERGNLATNISFQKRWTINAVRNFPYLLRTANVLHDVDKSLFRDKPVVIAAAGPSLNEEWDNLKQIKDKGLAYIFSVGSAVNGLIHHGIYPDAVCTYDPQSFNYRVVKIVDEKGIRSIPLIFGSTVGYETIENYQGPMLHMVTSRDSIAASFLKYQDEDKLSVEMVNDAPSIAVVAFQMLARMGADPIVLAGQNLAYLNNQYYAEGISYENFSNAIPEAVKHQAIKTNDVYGHEVFTTTSFNNMRRDLELYIRACPKTEVINTTKGGTAIEGTKFIPMEQVIKEKLAQSVVETGWVGVLNHYDLNYAILKILEMRSLLPGLDHVVAQLVKTLKNLQSLQGRSDEQQLRTGIDRVDKAFQKLQKNKYFKTFILPMMRVRAKHVHDATMEIQFESDLSKRVERIIEEIGQFVAECKANEQIMAPYFKELQSKINQLNAVGSNKSDR
jgi:Uncharacterized protein conserved in bacteria